MSAYGRLQNLAWGWSGPGDPCPIDDPIENWAIERLFSMRNEILWMQNEIERLQGVPVELFGHDYDLLSPSWDKPEGEWITAGLQEMLDIYRGDAPGQVEMILRRVEP